jgi:hypothetical protein
VTAVEFVIAEIVELPEGESPPQGDHGRDHVESELRRTGVDRCIDRRRDDRMMRYGERARRRAERENDRIRPIAVAQYNRGELRVLT